MSPVKKVIGAARKGCVGWHHRGHVEASHELIICYVYRTVLV